MILARRVGNQRSSLRSFIHHWPWWTRAGLCQGANL